MAIHTSLPTVRFGETDMQITRVGFGAWATGGDWAMGWGDQDDTQSINAIRHAISLGINWIDTAAIYGNGHSEKVVGEALRSIPASERPYVFTKCGLVWDDNNLKAFPQQLGTPASLRRELDASLRRLGVERIDLYQMHWPPTDGTPVEEYWQTLLDLKKEGKVRAVGLSNHNCEQLELALKRGHVDTLQPPFSAIMRAAAAEIGWCRERGTGVIVYSPMQSGLLSGSFTVERARSLPKNDWRSHLNPEFAGERLERNLALAAALNPIAERRRTSVGAVAISWALAWPGITAAIVGARSPQQVDGWADAASLQLTPAEVEEVARAIDHTGAGTGPSRPA